MATCGNEGSKFNVLYNFKKYWAYVGISLDTYRHTIYPSQMCV